MNKRLIKYGFFLLLSLPFSTMAMSRYSQSLCQQPDYQCIKVKPGQSWYSLFPDPEQRDIVKRVNRMNTNISPGMRIAVPRHLDEVTIYDVAPFPRYIDAPGEKIIYVSQEKLAWGAYDADGELLWWGPISSGMDFCSDINEECTTPDGDFRVIRKQGIDCVSTVFPKNPDGEDGGAPMPYCMHFYGGFALHGSSYVPGYRASHGCIRLFTEDARWLNLDFIDTPGPGRRGTRVVIN